VRGERYVIIKYHNDIYCLFFVKCKHMACDMYVASASNSAVNTEAQQGHPGNDGGWVGADMLFELNADSWPVTCMLLVPVAARALNKLSNFIHNQQHVDATQVCQCVA
jgi:hypothetical protein